ncbi:MAG: signal peptide peptidase SppA [Candidatus Pelagadaptatus aseana]|uniref:signal peptide peptidase SppA n=1 Tax=Candidatus Pelagadaptatus aseana TaxID=3120508 RepID=UPI0039B1DE54
MGLIKLFFRFLWRTITLIRNSLANLVFLVLILALIVALIPKEPPLMPENIALTIAPSGVLVDQYTYVAPLNRFLDGQQEQPAETLLTDVITSIERAAKDDRITALVLDLNDLGGGGLSKLQEVGSALAQFKATGKPIYANGDHFTQEQYYLAAYADTITMNPMGAVLLTGYGSYRNYFKDAFEKLALNFHVFRTGDYKDAIEPFIADAMSDASRENNSRWLNELWQSYTTNVEQQRQLAEGSVNEYITNIDSLLAQHQGDPAKLALQLGLVDKLSNHNQQLAELQDLLGEEEDGYRTLSMGEYLNYSDREHRALPDQVGVLVARGTILDGDHPAGTIGSETLSYLIRSVEDNPAIRALVVRIDSGGGSAFASEVIRQELALLREKGIPVVVSMGSVAASGGYWMAMAADEVWATPNTITGSIGVFSAFPTVENSLQKLGINTDGVGTTPLAGAMRIDRPLSPQLKAVMQQSVDNIYDRFLTLVAEARERSTDQIHEVAQGRVWSGTSAKELGLVDELGSLQDAIAAAAKLAELQDYSVEKVRLPMSPAELIAEQLARDLQMNTQNQSWLPELNTTWSTLSRHLMQISQPLQLLQPTHDPRSVYAQCMECSAP